MASNDDHACYTVLVVEADGAQRSLLREILNDLLPCRVVEAQDGEEAIERVGAAPPDLVLLDMHVPPKGGIAVLQWFRSTTTLQQVPVIVLSDSGPSDERLAHAGAVISSYVEKPYYLETLEDAIRAVLGARRMSYGASAP